MIKKPPISVTGKKADAKTPASSAWKVEKADKSTLQVPPISEPALLRPVIEPNVIMPNAQTALSQPVAPTMHHFTGTVAAPKLYIRGRSTLDGRLATTLRIRPSLIEDLEKVAVGPLYLLVDVAIQRLIQELVNMPKDAPSIAIAAETMDPGVYDRALLQESDRVPKKRVEYLHAAKARKAAEANESGADKQTAGVTDEPGDGVDK